MEDNNIKVMDESSDESMNQNKSMVNNSAWHDNMFEKGFLNTTVENENFKNIDEYIIPKIEIDSDSDIEESEDCSNSINPQPDSTNNQKHNFNEGESNESTVMSWIPNVSLKAFHVDQQATSSSQDVHNNVSPPGKKQANDNENQSLVFGRLITNEMIAIQDPHTLAKFKEKILKVIVNLNTGNL